MRKSIKGCTSELGLGERALGEFETVLGDPIREMTHKLLDPRLSETQKVAAIDQAAQAVQNAKVHEEQLEADAGALIQHGDFILQKITESRSLHRWLHGSDVLVYVRDRLRRSFEGCSVEASPPGSDTLPNYAIAGGQAGLLQLRYASGLLWDDPTCRWK